MTLRAYAETAAQRAAFFDQYAEMAAEAFNEHRWGEAINHATSALSLFENGQQYYRHILFLTQHRALRNPVTTLRRARSLTSSTRFQNISRSEKLFFGVVTSRCQARHPMGVVDYLTPPPNAM